MGEFSPVSKVMKNNLPNWARNILSSMAEVVMPHGDSLKLDLTDYSVDFIDKYVGYFPTHLRLAFPLGLLLLEFGPMIYMRKPSRFSKMNFLDREGYIQSWIDSKSSSRRDLIKGVKGLVMVAFYSHPRVMEHIDYDIEAHIKSAVARRY